jgi:CBS domain-containing protein
MAMLARDVMNPRVISVPSTMDLRELARLFLDKGITGAPVLDGKGRLAGVISQTDLVYYNLTRGDELVFDSHFYQSARVEGGRVPAGFQFEDCNTGCVADVMTPIVHAVNEATPIEDVARLMTRKHIHRVIVERGGEVAGIISALDVLKAQQGRPVAPRRRKAGTKRGERRAKKKARVKRS